LILFLSKRILSGSSRPNKVGMINTLFFHAWTNHRQRVNKIAKIRDEEGREWKKQNDIGEAFSAYF
jgi:hypothetical protein